MSGAKVEFKIEDKYTQELNFIPQTAYYSDGKPGNAPTVTGKKSKSLEILLQGKIDGLSESNADLFKGTVNNNVDHIMHARGGAAMPAELDVGVNGKLEIDDIEYQITLGRGLHKKSMNWHLATEDLNSSADHKSGTLLIPEKIQKLNTSYLSDKAKVLNNSQKQNLTASTYKVTTDGSFTFKLETAEKNLLVELKECVTATGSKSEYYPAAQKNAANKPVVSAGGTLYFKNETGAPERVKLENKTGKLTDHSSGWEHISEGQLFPFQIPKEDAGATYVLYIGDKLNNASNCHQRQDGDGEQKAAEIVVETGG